VSHLHVLEEKLKVVKQQEKERYQKLATGGLYKEQHEKHARQQILYEEEVARRKEAGEDEITFDEWQKKQKEKQDADKKKDKENLKSDSVLKSYQIYS